MSFLHIHRGASRLILSIPHAGTEIPAAFEPDLVSLWRARKDADWWLPELYAFAEALGATIIRTAISRSIIDVNRDPSGASLYPGQVTTGLCPTETFDGEPLYHDGTRLDNAAMAGRREIYFDPYHAAIRAEIMRLRHFHDQVVLYDCHSIRSVIPRLFPGRLPNFNIGTNDGKACEADLCARVAAICAADTAHDYVVNGRFKGGWITRRYGDPASGVQAIQMELACRGYMDEPETPDATNWPGALQAEPAILPTLRSILEELSR
ncbi:MAG: N-formylglutamate deformylase [Acidocella sp.]|nr:N-formylglutamate deformylase [Acidocella sp.]